MNPIMAMLPPPRPEQRNVSRNTVKSQRPTEELSITAKQTQTAAAAPFEVKLYGARFLSGPIPQLLKWNTARHKTPPLYETVGKRVKEKCFLFFRWGIIISFVI